ncbi:hypothetical protein C0J52_22246 [Blattella germanica]|nr:hypothetical protein C0J52_22246 [Blattella germanica]
MRLETWKERWVGGSREPASRSASVDTESEHDDPGELQLQLNSESSSPEEYSVTPSFRKQMILNKYHLQYGKIYDKCKQLWVNDTCSTWNSDVKTRVLTTPAAADEHKAGLTHRVGMRATRKRLNISSVQYDVRANCHYRFSTETRKYVTYLRPFKQIQASALLACGKEFQGQSDTLGAEIKLHFKVATIRFYDSQLYVLQRLDTFLYPNKNV